MNDQDMSQIEETKAKFKPIPIIAAVFFIVAAIVAAYVEVIKYFLLYGDTFHFNDIAPIYFPITLLLISILHFLQRRNLLLFILFIILLSYSPVLRSMNLVHSETLFSLLRLSQSKAVNSSMVPPISIGTGSPSKPGSGSPSDLQV